jgi:transposase
VPWGNWKTTTFVGALRVGEIAAPCVFDGPMDGPSFRAYIEQFVVPILRHDDVVVMDNLRSHKVAGIREAIETADAELTLPAVLQPRLQPYRTVLRQAAAAARQPALIFARPDPTEWLGVRGLELRNPCPSHVFEML